MSVFFYFHFNCQCQISWNHAFWLSFIQSLSVISSSVPLSFIYGSVHYTENIKGIRTWKMPYGINNIFHKLQEKNTLAFSNWTLQIKSLMKFAHAKHFQKLVRYNSYLGPLITSPPQIHTCEPSCGSIFLPILRVPSVNFQNLPPVKKIKYNKILTYILRSIFLEIPHLKLPRWRKTPRDTNGKGECHI
jgi:hypothetical protein